MSKSIIVVVEKPSVAARLSQAVKKHYPNADVTLLSAMPLSNIVFDYDAATDGSISTPIYAVRALTDFVAHTVKPGGEIGKRVSVSEKEFKNADEIVFACDPDHTGVVAFKVLVDEVIGDPKRRYPALLLKSLDDESIQKSFNEMTDFSDPKISELLQYGECKRYFDWNWNRKAIPIFKKVMDEMGAFGLNPEEGISKYGLQTLFALSKMQGEIKSEGALCEMMHKNGFGSACSMAKIIENLKYARMLNFSVKHFAAHPSVKSEISISEYGLEFLNRIGNKFEDPKISSRLNEFCMLAVNSVDSTEWKASVDSYLNDLFGDCLSDHPSLVM